MQLFTAGPSSSPKVILEALASPTLHHRSMEFQALFTYCLEHLKSIASLPHALSLSTSGSGGMESTLSSFSPKHTLILNHGKFSHRWGEIASSLQLPYTDFSIPLGQSHQVQDVLAYLQKRDFDCVCLQSCESSTGARSHFEEICRGVKNFDSQILTIIDGIASFGIEPIQSQNIDVLIASSQKALMLPSGLSFIFLSEYAKNKLQTTKPLSFYLSLQRYIKTPIAFSLPSSLFLGLQAYLQSIQIQENYQCIQERYESLKQCLSTKGIALFADYPSKGIIAFEDKNERIRDALRAQGILISGGQDMLKNKISRIGNFGILQDFDPLINALKNL